MKFNEWLKTRDPEYHEGWIKNAGMIAGAGLLGGVAGAMAPVAVPALGAGAGALTAAKYLAQKEMDKKIRRRDIRRGRPGFQGW